MGNEIHERGETHESREVKCICEICGKEVDLRALIQGERKGDTNLSVCIKCEDRRAQISKAITIIDGR
jgi:hypothetical protein